MKIMKKRQRKRKINKKKQRKVAYIDKQKHLMRKKKSTNFLGKNKN